mgnify:CR=1 FL=1|tara:strand:+ start:8398 stop:9012 length:615 start_codon:yes stop_codon:yes gene_type:complete
MTESVELKVVYQKTADIIPYINNPRQHAEEQITHLAASIKEFGFTNPILIDEKKTVIAGHGRLLAAKRINLIEVPTIQLIGLTNAQRKAYVIADNQMGLTSSWIDDLLKVNLQELDELDFDLSLLGWGSNLPEFVEAPDYGILDSEDLEDQLDEMAGGVKKAIQIEFEAEHYEEAQELVKFWRSEGAYIGMFLIDKLRDEKSKL